MKRRPAAAGRARGRAAWGVLAAVCCAAFACERGPDHERLGDRRYAERSFPDALAEYRLALRQRSPSPTLRAKFASAALRAGAIGEAVGAFRDLAKEGPAEADEAADGLSRAAVAAEGARDIAALSQAVTALREIQPDRPLGALAVALGASFDPSGRPADALDLLVQAAAVSGPGAADSLLVLYGDLNLRLTQYDAAQRVYEGVLRRSPRNAIARAARAGLAGCAVERGRDALGAGFLDDAAEWFGRAIAAGEPDSIVRMAWLLTGDARWAAGDSARAVEAYRRAAADAADDDPTAARANEQLRKLLGGGERERE